VNTKFTIKAFGLIKKPEIGNVPKEIQEVNLSVPEQKEKEVLVKILASTMHVDDVALAQGTAAGRFLGPKTVTEKNPYIMGTNFSGIIESIGNSVSQFKIGDEVIGIPNKTGESGSWATHRSIDQKNIRLKPKELTHQEVVSMLIAGCVAYGLILRSKVKKGDQCMVIGASGGIGSVVTQMLKAKGALVTAICSTRNVEMVIANGADNVIDYTKGNFAEKLASQHKKMDHVFDMVGGKEIEVDSIKVLQKKGQFLTVCGPVKYIGSEKLSWGSVMTMFAYILKRSVISKFAGPAYVFSETNPSKNINDMLEFVIEHKIKVPVDRVIPMEIEEMKKALEHLAAHKVSGRIVIDAAKRIQI
jgi:NADPH:quinone reductase-like Zn-dependent oxidoreductase